MRKLVTYLLLMGLTSCALAKGPKDIVREGLTQQRNQSSPFYQERITFEIQKEEIAGNSAKVFVDGTIPDVILTIKEVFRIATTRGLTEKQREEEVRQVIMKLPPRTYTWVYTLEKEDNKWIIKSIKPLDPELVAFLESLSDKVIKTFEKFMKDLEENFRKR